MTVDNFNLIRPHLLFNNKNEFYFIQIIQRKKDGNEGLHGPLYHWSGRGQDRPVRCGLQSL